MRNNYGLWRSDFHMLSCFKGWWHEQSRPDRHDYGTIRCENIRPGTENNFNKYTTAQVGQFYFPYDYDSVMHYSATGFSTNGQPTIQVNTPGATIGQRAGMSSGDIAEVRDAYGTITGK